MNNDYVYMCQKAIEIQDLWSPKSGDLYHYKGCFNTMRPNMFGSDINDGIISWDKDKNITGVDYKKDKFWMPRQEDLQKLREEQYGHTPYAVYKSFLMFWEDKFTWDKNMYDGFITPATPITNVWLMYIMYKLFNKKWDEEKEKWVIIE
jgi:hypothetical protein